jgi:oligopeptide/dipeptide ABC transporter ATP-binding protein
VRYQTFRGDVTALRDVSLDVRGSKIVAIVGESGCGKSTLGLALIGLLPTPPARVDEGEILYQGKNLLGLTDSEWVEFRGTNISMIFQEPMSSLDPVYSVGEQLTEAIAVREKRAERASANLQPTIIHSSDKSEKEKSNRPPPAVESQGISRKLKRNSPYLAEAVDALKSVQISDPDRVVDKYPHELSGGIAQRVMIAQVLLQRPSLLIADEPTSAVDVTTQGQLLTLMRKLRNEIKGSILFITHDLAVAAQISDEVIVMYAGEIVEHASAQDIFKLPLHPYAEALLRSFPRRYKDEGNLTAISGDVPNLRNPPPGCQFHPRCPYAFARCRKDSPRLVEVEPDHRVACFLRGESHDSASIAS